MPHFDEDDRDDVYEKDSKEYKENQNDDEGMEIDVNDDQVCIQFVNLLKYIPHKADFPPIYLLIKYLNSSVSKYFPRC